MDQNLKFENHYNSSIIPWVLPYIAHITENGQTRIQISPHFPRVYLFKNKKQTPLYSVTFKF